MYCVCDRARCACLVCVTGLDVLVWCVRQGWMYLSGVCDRAGCTCLVCDRAGCACLVCVTGLDVLVWCV